MSSWHKSAMIAFAAALLIAIWLFRFDLQVRAGGQSTAPAGYVLDRWTGDVHFVAPSVRRVLLDEANPKKPWERDSWKDLDEK